MMFEVSAVAGIWKPSGGGNRAKERAFASSDGAMPRVILENIQEVRELWVSQLHDGAALDWLAEIPHLQGITLCDLQLRALPEGMRRLKGLKRLDVESAYLSEIPAWIGELTSLDELHLKRAACKELPMEIGRLASLRSLSLSNVPITSLPVTIGDMSRLSTISLVNTKVASIPPQIGNLRELSSLRIHGSEVSELPVELSHLSENLHFKIEESPLREPLPSLIKRGVPELFAYLRTLGSGIPQYEAKVLLVGEGNVGKTSLVAALKGDAFVSDRDSTHGIEHNVLTVDHPELDVDIRLNLWDFGGQLVYRITHQFFYSPRSVYLLVWRPREGHEENDVEGWIKRIRLRVGEHARIVIVATYGDERQAELDYPSLQRKYKDILLGSFVVDNRTGRGIASLRQEVARHASSLPQMGELLSPSWVSARAEVLHLTESEPQISREEFGDLCARHTLDRGETAALVTLMHDLGHLIYFDQDDGLRDVVVLQPEWLTKAISIVLEDDEVRQKGGVLHHDHLRELWQGKYPEHFHPYFLRLMEKFDVSYRLEGGEASLVGQLVPFDRPYLQEEAQAVAQKRIRTLSMVYRMAEIPPGLIEWLIVRTHRFSMGRHWRKGMLIGHHSQQALARIEMIGDGRVELVVWAPAPDAFFKLLCDSIEYLISQRWEGLEYEQLVPCGKDCEGYFTVQSLERFREAGKATIDCHACVEARDVFQLLTGFGLPPVPEMLERIATRVAKIELDTQTVAVRAAESASSLRAVVTILGKEVTDCPRFFSLRRGRRPIVGLWKYKYTLTLWCEHYGNEHPCEDADYRVDRPKEWLKAVLPYALFVNRVLRATAPVVGAIPGVVLESTAYNQVKEEARLLEELAKTLPEQAMEHMDVGLRGDHLTREQGAGLRALRHMLFTKDPARYFGGLRRVVTIAGDPLWVCPHHYRQYDPGLPEF